MPRILLGLALMIAIPPVIPSAASAASMNAIESSSGPDLLDELLAVETPCDAPCPPANAAASLRSRMDELTGEARLYLNATEAAERPDDPYRRVAALNRFIFSKLGIKPSHDLTDPDNLMLGQVLARKQGYCVGIASLYLVLADRLGLPVRAVATPSHMFLRYDDGVTRINIETFQEGAALPDDEYAREERIPPESIRRGIFLRNLSDDEFLAQVHNNLGVIESGKRNYALAATRYEQALELYPRFPAALYNYGTDLLHEGRAAEAARLLSKSLRLYPADPWALNNRGLAYLQIGRTPKAKSDFEAALRIDPGLEPAKRNLETLTAHGTSR